MYNTYKHHTISFSLAKLCRDYGLTFNTSETYEAVETYHNRRGVRTIKIQLPTYEKLRRILSRDYNIDINFRNGSDYADVAVTREYCNIRNYCRLKSEFYLEFIERVFEEAIFNLTKYRKNCNCCRESCKESCREICVKTQESGMFLGVVLKHLTTGKLYEFLGVTNDSKMFLKEIGDSKEELFYTVEEVKKNFQTMKLKPLTPEELEDFRGLTVYDPKTGTFWVSIGAITLYNTSNGERREVSVQELYGSYFYIK